MHRVSFSRESLGPALGARNRVRRTWDWREARYRGDRRGRMPRHTRPQPGFDGIGRARIPRRHRARSVVLSRSLPIQNRRYRVYAPEIRYDKAAERGSTPDGPRETQSSQPLKATYSSVMVASTKFKATSVSNEFSSGIQPAARRSSRTARISSRAPVAVAHLGGNLVGHVQNWFLDRRDSAIGLATRDGCGGTGRRTRGERR